MTNTKAKITTVRLPLLTEQRLNLTAQTRNCTKSKVIQEALEYFFYKEEHKADSWTVGEPYFGKYGSGNGNLSTDYKTLLKEKLHARHRAG